MSANVTDVLSTCDFWQLTASGGTPPYSVMLAAPGAPSTNVTMGKGENQYTYVNRALPKGTLLAAISDSTGAWAAGTPYVRTQGSSDTSCPGRESSSGIGSPSTTPSSVTSTTSSTTSPSNPTSNENKGSTNKVPIIVGVSVGVGVLLILGAAIFFFCVRKRRAAAKHQYLKPQQFQETGSQVLLSSPASPPKSARSEPVSGTSSIANAPTSRASIPSSYEPRMSDGGAALPQLPPSSAITSKAREASSSHTNVILPSRRTAPSSHSEDSRWPQGAVSSMSEAGEILIQHTDARAVRVRELPPPYGTQTFAED
ncbi:hypothetical protein H0H87_000859 [Tephrocybe sp. NHM501043]|nr:hypothetical protein H0H87_000859 [Tephrocybe sp. NHM501043]